MPSSKTKKTCIACADPRGSNSDVFLFFLVGKWRKDPITIISRPSLARQQSAIKMAFCWCAYVGPNLNAGLIALWFFRGSGPVLLRNPIFLWFFRGGPDPLSPPLPPSGSAHAFYTTLLWIILRTLCKLHHLSSFWVVKCYINFWIQNNLEKQILQK